MLTWLGTLTTAIIGALIGSYLAYQFSGPPAPPVALFSWAGWYIGGHVGGGWSRNTWSGLDDG